jgi:hypothetical protein
LPVPLMLASMNPRSAIFRALMVNPGSWVSLDEERVYARNLEVPSGGGVGTVEPWRGRTACSRPEAGSSVCARTPCRRSARQRFHRRTGSMTKASKQRSSFRWASREECPSWPFGHAGAFRRARRGGFPWLRRPSECHGIRLCHQPHGGSDGGSPRSGAEECHPARVHMTGSSTSSRLPMTYAAYPLCPWATATGCARGVGNVLAHAQCNQPQREPLWSTNGASQGLRPLARARIRSYKKPPMRQHWQPGCSKSGASVVLTGWRWSTPHADGRSRRGAGSRAASGRSTPTW